MTRAETILSTMLALVLIVSGIAGFLLWQVWRSTNVDLVKMRESFAEQRRLAEESNQRLAQTTAELKTKLQDIESLRRSITTPAQIIREIPQQIPGVQPIIVQTPPTPEQPAPTPVAQMPIEQLKPLFDFVLVCKETTANLEACTSEKKELGVQIQAMTIQRN